MLFLTWNNFCAPDQISDPGQKNNGWNLGKSPEDASKKNDRHLKTVRLQVKVTYRSLGGRI